MSRKIKIHSDIRYKRGYLSGRRDRVEFPILKLSGLWLLEAGIAPGTMVNVTIEHHLLYGSRLIIEPLKP
jgi:hypothetical protein